MRSDGPSDDATLFGLAPCGVLPAIRVATNAVRSYRTFSPLPFDSPLRGSLRARPRSVYDRGPASGESRRGESRGGMFSVPLSVRLPCPGVTRRTALWSSDFPPASALGTSCLELRRAGPAPRMAPFEPLLYGGLPAVAPRARSAESEGGRSSGRLRLLIIADGYNLRAGFLLSLYTQW